MSTSFLTIKHPIAQLSDEILGTAYLSLWMNIQNAKALLENIRAATPPEEFKNVIFINAEMIYSPAHFMAALQKAFLNHKLNQMKMRTLGTEILYLLSPFANLKQTFEKFGMTASTKHILFLYIPNNEDISSSLFLKNPNPCSIQGTPLPWQEVSQVCNVEQICSVHNLPLTSDTLSQENSNFEVEKTLELSLIEKIAVKGLL